MTIDLDNIRERAVPTRDGFYHVVGAYRVMREEDFAALLDEVERLRENGEARERVMRRECDLLRAAQREVDELRAVYAALRQTSADLCVVCGWRFFVPGVGCQGCERARLAGEVDDLRLQRSERRERAAVVAWLNAEAERVDCGHIEDLADRIERGEHREEDK